jgi:diguanylate cyclase (GGDEF)-like protein
MTLKEGVAEIITILDSVLIGNYDVKEIDNLPTDLIDLYNKIAKLAKNVKEMSLFAREIARGNLEPDIPAKDNFLAFVLKDLNSKLNHINWQASQVAKGNFNLSLDYMGELTDNFNNMIKSVANREAYLKKEIDNLTVQKTAINLQYEGLTKIFDSMEEIVIVFDGREVLFANNSFNGYISMRSGINNRTFVNFILSHDPNITPVEHFEEGKKKWFRLEYKRILWLDNRDAYIVTATNITSEKRSMELLEKNAYLDALTGLRNRFAMLNDLTKGFENPQNFPVSLIFIDMDKLKKINDSLGHLYGDNYLKGFSIHLKSITISYAKVYRYGGDEFIILLFGKNKEEAKLIIQDISDKFIYINQDDPNYNYEFSFGIYTAENERNATIDEMISKADAIMYEQKKAKMLKRGQ